MATMFVGFNEHSLAPEYRPLSERRGLEPINRPINHLWQNVASNASILDKNL